MSAALKTPAEIYEASCVRVDNHLGAYGSHCLQAMQPFFLTSGLIPLPSAAAMLDLAKRDGIRMRVAISNCISHTYDVGWACVPF